MTLQDTLTFETLASGEILKRALTIDYSKLNAMAFQKTNVAAAAGSSTNYKKGERKSSRSQHWQCEHQMEVIANNLSCGKTKKNSSRSTSS